MTCPERRRGYSTRLRFQAKPLGKQPPGLYRSGRPSAEREFEGAPHFGFLEARAGREGAEEGQYRAVNEQGVEHRVADLQVAQHAIHYRNRKPPTNAPSPRGRT